MRDIKVKQSIWPSVYTIPIQHNQEIEEYNPDLAFSLRKTIQNLITMYNIDYLFSILEIFKVEQLNFKEQNFMTTPVD